ncbi:hypothetical protein Tco_0864091 [Tanacetum coccineum]
MQDSPSPFVLRFTIIATGFPPEELRDHATGLLQLLFMKLKQQIFETQAWVAQLCPEQAVFGTCKVGTTCPHPLLQVKSTLPLRYPIVPTTSLIDAFSLISLEGQQDMA